MLGFLILFISYAWKVGSLFDGVCSAYQQWVRYPVQCAFEKLLMFTARRYVTAQGQSNAQRFGWLLLHRVVVAVWVPYFAVFETLASFSTAIWIACLGLVFGTIQIAVPRKQNQPLLGANENTWSFGQLVPLILLIQPSSVVWETLIHVPKNTTQEESEDRNINTVSESTTSNSASLNKRDIPHRSWVTSQHTIPSSQLIASSPSQLPLNASCWSRISFTLTSISFSLL